jgi:capsule biosynthesis phosphatase
MSDYSFPKPLNMINGKPSISHCLQHIPDSIGTLHFIAAPHLAEFNFEQIIKNQFPRKQCIVHWIPYFTRGPIETAWLGIRDIKENGESVVFLDNDVVYNFPAGFFEDKTTAFLGYAQDNTGSEAYSFLTVRNGVVTDYKEKKRISDLFCCGVYGFASLAQFRATAQEILTEQIDSEMYMSAIYERMLATGIPIRGLHFAGDIYHIGSLKELNASWDKIEKKPMRVCFDLDNTLVTYPHVPGDYSTVRPVPRMIALAHKMKADGHTIIIHTARRMATHKNNVGAVIRNIGAVTFRTLEEFDIPCDEILFGKPIADMYIDDRAVNPYRDSVELMGYLHPEPTKPLNMIETNKHNHISLADNKITKTGPATFMRGEIHFYENIPTSLAKHFPRFYGAEVGVEQSKLVIEHIKGIPLYTLYKHGLATEKHILQLFECVDIMHHISVNCETPSQTDILANYSDKLRARFLVKDDYPFEDAAVIQQKCLEGLASYVPTVAPCIHGDLWFSNIIVDYKGALKMIDMKGQVNGRLCIGGDVLYDYGKLYQSFLGYDAAIYGDTIDVTYKEAMMNIFVREVEKRGISLANLKSVTNSLIIGTLPFIKEGPVKERVWTFIRELIQSSS